MAEFNLKRAKFSTFKIKKIISHFCFDIPTSKTAGLVSINRNMINLWFKNFVGRFMLARCKNVNVTL